MLFWWSQWAYAVLRVWKAGDVGLIEGLTALGQDRTLENASPEKLHSDYDFRGWKTKCIQKWTAFVFLTAIKIATNLWFKWQKFIIIVLKAESLKSRHWQSWTASEGSREKLIFFFSSFWFFGIRPCHSILCLCLHAVFSSLLVFF